MPKPETLSYALGDQRIKVNLVDYSVSADGRQLRFSPLDFNLFSIFAREPDTVHSSQSLCEQIWNDVSDFSVNRLKVHVSHIRQALGPELGDIQLGVLRTKRGLGYYALSTFAEDRWQHALERGDESIYATADERVLIAVRSKLIRIDGIVREDFSTMQHKLLSRVGRTPNRTVGFLALQNHIYNEASERQRQYLTVLMSASRKKLGPELGDPWIGAFRTQRGVGYYAVSSLDLKPKRTLSTE